MPMDDDVTLGELGRRMNMQSETLAREFGQLRSDFSSLRAESVLRAEYEVRMGNTDREVREMKATHLRELRDLEEKTLGRAHALETKIDTAAKTFEEKMEAKSLPWPVVVSSVAAVAALIITILPKLVS